MRQHATFLTPVTTIGADQATTTRNREYAVSTDESVWHGAIAAPLEVREAVTEEEAAAYPMDCVMSEGVVEEPLKGALG